MTLDTIQVLFRSPSFGHLYGIPYAMRPGQGPADLWNSRRLQRYNGRTTPNPGPGEDWVWLGAGDWYGTMAAEDVAAVKEFLAEVGSWVPETPGEWATREDWEGRG